MNQLNSELPTHDFNNNLIEVYHRERAHEMGVNWKIMQIPITYSANAFDINKRNLNGGLAIRVPNADDVRINSAHFLIHIESVNTDIQMNGRQRNISLYFFLSG